jgi:hypothetical protein
VVLEAGCFNTPSQSLVNAYEPGDVRKDATIMFAGTTLYDGRFTYNSRKPKIQLQSVLISIY